MSDNNKAASPNDVQSIFNKYVELHKKYLYISSGNMDFRTTELARHLGVNRRTIQRWIKGAGRPGKQHQRGIESFLRKRGL